MCAESRAPGKRSRPAITFAILACLHGSPGMHRTVLAACVSVNGARMARTVPRLVANGIIEERDKGLYLTQKGETALVLVKSFYELVGVNLENLLGDLAVELPAGDGRAAGLPGGAPLRATRDAPQSSPMGP